MSEVVKLWKKYNECSQQLSSALGRTNNIVGEYGEYLAQKYTAGRLLETSKQSADIKTCDGNLYQVKARTIKSSRPESLSIIRSWKFDFLLVILFDTDGLIQKSIISPVSVAQDYGKLKKYENGWIVTTTKKFLCDVRNTDITNEIQDLNS